MTTSLTSNVFGNTEYVCITILGYLSDRYLIRYDPIPEPVPPATEWNRKNPLYGFVGGYIFMRTDKALNTYFSTISILKLAI